MKVIQDNDFNQLVGLIKRVMDFDPDNYKFAPLRRRIWSRMRRLGIDNYRDYTEELLKKRNEVITLCKALTVNLTRFFRNKAVFEYIKDEILPSLNNPYIWSAGCTSGAELYSLAILCSELKANCSIIGTDIDIESLKKAKECIYSPFSIQETDPVILGKVESLVGHTRELFKAIYLKDRIYKKRR